jgi:hypothetical protein
MSLIINAQTIMQIQPSCKNGHDGILAVTENAIFISGYLWSTGATTRTITNLAPGTYTCQIGQTNGGTVTQTGTVDTVTDATASIAAAASCGITDGQVKISPTNYNIGINDTSVIKLNGISYITHDTTSILITASGGHNLFTVARTINNAFTCFDTLPILVPTTRPPLPICLVSVNQTSTYNTLIWDKTNVTPVDSFCIYRETQTNVYSKIATVPPDSISEYNDLTANPNVTSYTYVITVKDTCGNESVYSNSHSTIHLQDNGNGNFSWTLYQIQNTPNPVNYYIMYRDNLGDGNFAPISSTIPGTNTTFTDIDYDLYPNAKYYISVSWNITCSPSRSAVLSTTRSNIKSRNTATGITEVNNNNKVLIFPNPTSGIFQISGDFKIANVYTNTGILILSTSEKTVNLNGFSDGLYFVEANNNFYKVIKN